MNALANADPDDRPLTAQERMQRSRSRRKKGLRCFILEIRDVEIEALIRRGYLQPDARNDSEAIRKALYQHLDRSLGAN